jgi:hypothetical protein
MISANSTRFTNYVIITQPYRATAAEASPRKTQIIWILRARIIDGDEDLALRHGNGRDGRRLADVSPSAASQTYRVTNAGKRLRFGQTRGNAQPSVKLPVVRERLLRGGKRASMVLNERYPER